MESIEKVAATIAYLLVQLFKPGEAIMVLSQARQIIERNDAN